jgi:mannose-1-phosphate guanylyltransferase
MGINNAIVAASPDGILIADKQVSHEIKGLVNDLNFRPMFEERRWGWYKVLDFTKYEDGQEVLTKRIGVKAGGNLSYQVHKYRCETWTIIKGEGIFALNDQLRVIRAGDVLEIPVYSKHAIKAITDLEIIEVQYGSKLIEEDIERIFYKWEEIESICYQSR